MYFLFKYIDGIILISNSNIKDMDIEDVYYWLVMEKFIDVVVYM